ncbi:unnamed protein product [Meloidogyne enterolobii]|uniref:Uncharacterized protein n=1 Tax=Meloidogyne enterolobii TaxID=390850 RepID=A0ACB1AIE4_MELEN
MKIKIHPFDFLQNVVYNVKIKPLNKRFEKLGGQEYEEIVEYFKNPDNFIKNEKRKLRENSVEFLYKEFKEIKKILEVVISPFFSSSYANVGRIFFTNVVTKCKRRQDLSSNYTVNKTQLLHSQSPKVQEVSKGFMR